MSIGFRAWVVLEVRALRGSGCGLLLLHLRLRTEPLRFKGVSGFRGWGRGGGGGGLCMFTYLARQPDTRAPHMNAHYPLILDVCCTGFALCAKLCWSQDRTSGGLPKNRRP